MRAIPLLTKQVRRVLDEKQLWIASFPSWVCLFSDFIAWRERTSRTLFKTAVLFNWTMLIFTVPQWPHVFWFNDHTQKRSQNNPKNTRQTSLEFTSLPRQKLKLHVWWSCFPYRRRNSGIVWTADGCSITTMTKGLSPEQCKHRLPRDVTSLSSFERSWV